MPEKKLFKVVVTAIVVKDPSTGAQDKREYLIMQRSPNEKKFPSPVIEK